VRSTCGKITALAERGNRLRNKAAGLQSSIGDRMLGFECIFDVSA